MRNHPIHTAALSVLVLCLLAFGWVYFIKRDTPPQFTVSSARLRWVRGVNNNGPAGQVRLSRTHAKRLAHFIAPAGGTWFSRTTSCPMDTGQAIHAQFANGSFSYPVFTIKLDGCSGTLNHQMSDQLYAFLNAHKPK